jgi:hypothetical protein
MLHEPAHFAKRHQLVAAASDRQRRAAHRAAEGRYGSPQAMVEAITQPLPCNGLRPCLCNFQTTDTQNPRAG